VFAYALFDINFALATARFEEQAPTEGDGSFHRGWYYVGATAPLVGTFAGATLVGALAGRVIGEGLGLSFAIPLIFVALVVPRLTDRAAAATAAVAAGVAVVAAGLPFNAGLLVAAACGTVAGVVIERVDDDADEDTEGRSA
jgi:predicted branched-subunit amino acid permease